MPKNNSPVSTLRVISGSLKGRKLVSPHSATTHPMGAREKNALFNMIDVRGQRVLDAYAGSGALGIEALSRGAREVVFVENDHRAVAAIKQNLESLGLVGTGDFASGKANIVAGKEEVFAGKVDIFAGKVADFVKSRTEFDDPDVEECVSFSHLSVAAPASSDDFDIIIADPPYDKIDLAEITNLASLLAAGGIMVLSSPASQPIPEIAGLTMYSSHTYAEARVTVYNKE